jgi:hypothetical protein
MITLVDKTFNMIGLLDNESNPRIPNSMIAQQHEALSPH